MGVLATDDFNRANGGLGANWTAITGTTFSIVSNAVPTSFGADAAAYYSNATWPADQYAQATFTAISGASSDSGAGLMLRCDGTDQNLYRLVCNTTQIEIGKVVSGSYSAITTRTAAAGGDVVRFEAQGTTLRCFKNGVQAGADITDSGLSTGRAGIFFSSGADGTIDNFEGGDFGAAVPGPPSFDPIPFMSNQRI